jgi:hypothetical protein
MASDSAKELFNLNLNLSKDHIERSPQQLNLYSSISTVSTLNSSYSTFSPDLNNTNYNNCFQKSHSFNYSQGSFPSISDSTFSENLRKNETSSYFKFSGVTLSSSPDEPLEVIMTSHEENI